MATLSPIWFNHTGSTGEKVEYKAVVTVTTDGMFRVSVPDELVEHLYKYREAKIRGDVIVHKSHGSHRVEARTLRVAKDFVDEAVKDFLKSSREEECFLAYRYRSELAYWKNPDGSITHNGGASDAESEGRWGGCLSGRASDEKEAAGISFAAFALVKVTNARGSTVKIDWEFWRDTTHGKNKDHMDDSDVRSRLNFISMGESPDDPSRGGWTVIPYDPKAAEFFYRVIHSLCRIDDQLRTYFTNKEAVQLGIQSGQFLALK